MENRKLVFANWKMNLDIKSSLRLINDIQKANLFFNNLDIVIAPPGVYLYEISKFLEGSHIQLSSQNVFYENNGPYTGEISPQMLKDVGCKWVMIGHSERRQHILETNEMINKKILLSCNNDLNIICCVGESYEERRQGKTFNKIGDQLKRALRDVSANFLNQIVIGYEPVWVIGSGKAAEISDINEVHDFIFDQLKLMYPDSKILPRIVYGGSVNNTNISSIMTLNNVDGVLVGNASLDCDKFCDIVLKVGNSND